MLTLLYHLQALRWGLPAVCMLGSAPSFFFVWCGWRTVTAVLPTNIYTKRRRFSLRVIPEACSHFL